MLLAKSKLTILASWLVVCPGSGTTVQARRHEQAAIPSVARRMDGGGGIQADSRVSGW
jgi:hypothetical protein